MKTNPYEQLQFIEYLREQEQVKHKNVNRSYFRFNEEALAIMDSEERDGIKAEKLLLKAFKLTNKNPFTRASACHELGVLYYSCHTTLPGGVYRNLKKSVEYLTRAIESKERKQYLELYVKTLSQLGIAYRRAATEYLWPESRSECLNKAEDFQRKAIKLISKFKFKFEVLAQETKIYYNLSTVLFDKNNINEACNMQAVAFERFIQFHKLSNQRAMSAKQIFCVTYSRLNYYSKDKSHKKLCEYILKIAPDFGVDTELVMLTNPISDTANPETEILLLVNKARKSESDKDIDVLTDRMSLLMRNRQETKTDQESDALAILIQLTTSGLARQLIKKDRNLDAFVRLEAVCAMRFCEGANKFWQVAKDKRMLLLFRALQHLGASYFSLNELSLLLNHIDDKAQLVRCISETVDNIIKTDLKYNKTEESVLFGVGQYIEDVRESKVQKNPSDFLQGVANIYLEDFKKLENEIDKIDPEYANKRKMSTYIVPETIETALQKNPELTLLKIDIESEYDDVLIIAASMQDGKIITNGVTFKLPENLINNIGEFVNKDKITNEAWPLDFIDWKSILPSGSRKVALLTSFFASQVPWVATGRESEKLLDLVDEVNYLPTILYLSNTVTHFDKKEGALVLAGGGTQFNKLALAHQDYLADNLDSTKIISSIIQANIVTYYGHCEHKHPNRPSLLFQGHTLRDMELLDAVAGAERVEFWACQSGSNIPLHFLGSCVNEAFGMDMQMIQWGAKTSIGSLWAVPELVTAHIKNYYDKLISKGNNASQALLSAQRWWINDGADEQLKIIQKIGVNKYLSSFTSEDISSHNGFSSVMGPVFSTSVNKIDIGLSDIENSFKHPSAWAGMRFCGISEQKSEYIPRSSLTLNNEDHHYFDKLIDSLNLKSGFICNGR